ncbi:hydroxyacid dehydrogenase [Pedobacter yonginense]|uniref:Hydroxyacid dehydrogenase n=1 Tax=Pedobacter yonginense TaxID=651869 RepID=A0A317ESD8_9SPHI|nr:phosphoglycerate dehydrogenase [Pedobacter yonginense]PWS28176.1 hydroxyacid dehydrogenase [Pedobacter yonginense]
MKVVVSAVAFSKNQELVNALKSYFPDAVVNTEGKRFTRDELVQYYEGADAIITGLETINEDLLSDLPKLKIIAKYGVGLDNIDLEACANRNVKIGWVGGVNKESVAEITIGFMLMLSRNLYLTSNQLKTLHWNKSGGFSLNGRCIGIIGVGHIGKELIRLLKPFNANVIVNDIVDVSDFAKANDVQMVDKETLFKMADIVTVHTPLTAETKNMINKDTLAIMKSTASVINTARGGIVNEEDLKEALSNNVISGAALDVYEVEPPTDSSLLGLPNLICTPHIAGNAYQAVVDMGMASIHHILNYQKENTISDKISPNN